LCASTKWENRKLWCELVRVPDAWSPLLETG
jgi:hypothetical protein